VAEFVADLRAHNVTPHIAQNTTNRRSALDRRTTRHPGSALSGRVRKRIEEVFGWTKTAVGFRKTRHPGMARIDWVFTLTATSYNPLRPGIAMPGICPDSATTGKIRHKTCSPADLQQLKQE